VKNRQSRVLVLALTGTLLLVTPLLCWSIVERIFNPPLTPTIECELGQLYAADRFADVTSACERAERDSRYLPTRPQILYIHWAAERRLRDIAASDRVADVFLRAYPDHYLAADLYFDQGIRLLSEGDYKAAKAKLTIIEGRFPSSAVAIQAKRALADLD
jgi:outer membrane protein assembly factor BamD (BamD/ComL family)